MSDSQLTQMEKITNLKTVINKKGSYILESSISLPIFMIAVIVMCSIILMFACIEDANFIVATELRRAAAEAIAADTSTLVPFRINGRVKEHSQVERLGLKDYVYRQRWYNEDEIIAISYDMKLRTSNPLDLASEANYNVALVTRAFVGKIRDEEAMSAEEMMNAAAEAVYIFPKLGEKYHNADCTFLHAAYKSTVLSEELKKEYNACPICHSKNAEIGSTVYYFPAGGDDYHLPDCKCLERNYIEIDKATAIERGYQACSKCGG